MRKIYLSLTLALSSFASSALINACDTKTETRTNLPSNHDDNNKKPNDENKKPETKEERIAREKNEIKEYFANYDYLCGPAAEEINEVPKFEESEISENTLYNLEVQKNKFSDLLVHPDGYSNFRLIVSEDIFQKLNDVGWDLYLKKQKSSNKLTFTIKDKEINDEIEQYENKINYFFSDINFHVDEWKYRNEYTQLSYALLNKTTSILEKIFGKESSSLSPIHSLYPEKELEEKVIERTATKKAEIIWNHIKWIDTGIEQKLSNQYGLTKAAKTFVKKEPNQKKLEYILQLPFSKYEYDDRTLDNGVKWVDFSHYLNIDPCPEELITTVKKLETINKSVVSKSTFINAASSETGKLTQDNLKDLRNNLCIEMSKVFFDSLDSNINLFGKKLLSIQSYSQDVVDEDGQLFQAYEWTIKKGDKETRFNFYVKDFAEE